MIEYREETFDECISELIPLLIQNQREVDAKFKTYEGIEFNPDFETYRKQADSGLLKMLIARKNQLLVGYMLVIVAPSIRYKDCVFAFQDIFYVDPAHRGSGFKFLKWCEKYLKENYNVKIITQSTKAHDELDFSKALTRMGYELHEKVYFKNL